MYTKTRLTSINGLFMAAQMTEQKNMFHISRNHSATIYGDFDSEANRMQFNANILETKFSPEALNDLVLLLQHIADNY